MVRNYKFWIKQVGINNPVGKPRRLASIDTLVFHRIHAGHPETDDAASIAKMFEEDGMLLIKSNIMPYPFVIPRNQPEGQLVVVEQTTPLTRLTYHAEGWNTRSVGVGVVGDCRSEKPTDKQRAACVWLAQRLQDTLEPWLPANKHFLPTTHSAITTGSKRPGGPDECPGPLFAPTWREVRETLREHGKVCI